MRESFRFSLRLSWKGFAGWAVGVALMVVAVLATYHAAAPTPEDAQRLAASMMPLAKSFQALLGKAEALDTPGGFLTWRLLGVLPLIVSIYTVLLAARLTLGDERRGITDLVLSTSLSRRSLILGQGLALTVVCLGIGLLGMGISWMGARGLGLSLGMEAALGAGLMMGLLLLVWSSLSILIAQFSEGRGAAGAITATIMVGAYLITNLGETDPGVIRVLSWFSPFTAYQEFRPLVRGGITPLWSPLALAGLCIALWVGTAALFARRDVNYFSGRRLFAGSREQNASRLLRGPLTRDLWSYRGNALAWAVGVSAFLVLLVLVDESIRTSLLDFLGNAGAIGQIFMPLVAGDQPLAVLIFGGYVGPIVAVYAVLAVSRWSNDFNDGLLAPALSTTVSRARLLASRAAAVIVALAAGLAVAWGVVNVVTLMRGMTPPDASLARTMVAGLTVALVFVGIGFAVSSWGRPSWGAPVAGALAALNFVFDILSQAVDVPDWTTKLSIFERMGNPVREQLAWDKQGLLFLIGVILLGLALAGFNRKDVPG